jgi:hypothetical protein
MRLVAVACLAAALAACDGLEPDGRRKISSGGPGVGPGGIGGVDAAPRSDAAPDVLHGRVCIATDLHTPEACVTQPGAGLPVSDLVSGAATTTASDGTFALALAGATSALVDVETGGDTTITPSVENVANTGAQVIVPVVDATVLSNLETDLGSPVGDGQGVLVLFVQDGNGKGLPGFVATSPPGFLNNVFYDATTAIGWSSSGATGDLGGVLMMGVTAGTYVIQLSNTNTAAQTSVTVRIVGQHVTFATTIVTP